jgi:hypothetical protein
MLAVLLVAVAVAAVCVVVFFVVVSVVPVRCDEFLHALRRANNLVVDAKAIGAKEVLTLRVANEAVSGFQTDGTLTRFFDKVEVLVKLHIALQTATAPAIQENGRVRFATDGKVWAATRHAANFARRDTRVLIFANLAEARTVPSADRHGRLWRGVSPKEMKE